MSRQGFRTKEESSVVRLLVSRGWVQGSRNGSNHVQMLWPASGVVVTLPGKMCPVFANKIIKRVVAREKAL